MFSCLLLQLLLVSVSADEQQHQPPTAQQPVRIAFMNAEVVYDPDLKDAIRDPEKIVFVSNIQPVFGGDPGSKIDFWINAEAAGSIRKVIAEFCRSKSFPEKEINVFNVAGQIMGLLRENGMEVMVPKVSLQGGDNSLGRMVPNMTLMEKARNPITVQVRKYRAVIKGKGEISRPTLSFLVKLGSYDFKGPLELDADFDVEIIASRTGEVIDRIEFHKQYLSDPVELAVASKLGPTPAAIEKRPDSAAITKMLEAYYKDLSGLFIAYDYKTAVEFLKN
jgi:hypothetical protein